ncbi:MAG TPA: TRAP transporter small permease [Pseudolabrys sp.]|nr:TRAP transporter small permease [Pseudolabrys sp.]
MVVGCADAAATAADFLGHAASLALALLTLGIILGIVLRWVGIDNSWTYDFDLFTLVWSAFAGAAYTSLRGRHVTAGIAIENVIGRGTLLSVLRAIVIVGFLILLAVSGIWDTFSSWQTSETTVDVEQWPVWIAKAALPVGVAFWALAEVAKFLRTLVGIPLRQDEVLDE